MHQHKTPAVWGVLCFYSYQIRLDRCVNLCYTLFKVSTTNLCKTFIFFLSTQKALCFLGCLLCCVLTFPWGYGTLENKRRFRMKIKHETVNDIVLLLKQKVGAYEDHLREIEEEQQEINDLLEQLEARFPVVGAINRVRAALRDDILALAETYPEYVGSQIYYLEEALRDQDSD